MDRIFITGLKLDVLIGVYASERDAAQPLSFDIEFGFDNRLPAASDDLADTIDYAAVVARLRDWLGHTRYELLEALLEQMAAMLKAEFNAGTVRIRVHKPNAAAMLGCDDVGIEILR